MSSEELAAVFVDLARVRPGFRGTLLSLAALVALAQPSFAQSEGGYLGDEVCAACHKELLGAYAKTIHAKVFTESNARTPLMKRGCEACHGPARAHVQAGGGKGVGDLITFRGESPETARRENAACLACHQGGERLYWKGSAHQSREVACTSCHTLMSNHSDRGQLAQRTEMNTCGQCHLIQRSRQYRNSHMPLREGKMSCSSCHNPHGTIADSLIDHVTVNDNCYACHAEKRGPFLWEHPPVNENCLNCHQPHGSTREAMLKLGMPRLCQGCHIETRHPTDPRDANSRFVLGGSCLNCHPNIHGSNHPSGSRFTR